MWQCWQLLWKPTYPPSLSLTLSVCMSVFLWVLLGNVWEYSLSCKLILLLRFDSGGGGCGVRRCHVIESNFPSYSVQAVEHIQTDWYIRWYRLRQRQKPNDVTITPIKYLVKFLTLTPYLSPDNSFWNMKTTLLHHHPFTALLSRFSSN